MKPRRLLALAVSTGALTVLAACGGSPSDGGASSAAPATSSAPASSAAATPTPSATASPTSSATGAEATFVSDFNAKVDAGDYTPPDGVKKDVDAAKAYMAKLGDNRLVAAGKYVCAASKAGVTKSQFLSSILANPGTEEDFKQLTPLAWDESVNVLCGKS